MHVYTAIIHLINGVKKHANRIFRKQNKLRLKTQRNLLYKVREIADNYNFLSDGPLIYIHKHWYNYLSETGSIQEECNELYNKIFRKWKSTKIFC